MAETDQIKPFVVLFDIHFPLTIPALFDPSSPKKRTPILRFLRDFSPRILIYGGDGLDFPSIAFWNKNKPRLKEGSRIAKDYAGFNLLLDAVETATPKADRREYLSGNHEERIQSLIDEQPELEGLIEVDTNLRLKQRKYKWIPSHNSTNIGKLHIIHGDWKPGILPINHTRQALIVYGNRNLLYGHSHTNQSATAVSPIDAHPVMATCVGTLGNVNPYWRRDFPSSWVNSFAAGYLYPNGNFNLYTINVNNGQFFFDGVNYK